MWDGITPEGGKIQQKIRAVKLLEIPKGTKQ
jgi:hypothetical protein